MYGRLRGQEEGELIEYVWITDGELKIELYFKAPIPCNNKFISDSLIYQLREFSLIHFFQFQENLWVPKIPDSLIISAMSSVKQAFKIGEMIIDQKQIFWKMQYCYALIPIVQLLDGRNHFIIQMFS